MRSALFAATALALISPSGADATTTITFDGVCGSSANGTKAACTSVAGGGAVTLKGANDLTLQVRISAWQINQSNDTIRSASLGAFSNGFGVTGGDDAGGANNLHTFDNVGGYTDFIMLQFNRAVSLTGINRFVYDVPPSGNADSDGSYANASGAITPTPWNQAINLSGTTAYSSYWTAVDGNGTSGSTTISNSGFSSVWLVGASTMTSDRDDGFKLKQFMVVNQTPAVPEPATWAMMILGFGAVGYSLRRRGAAPVLA
jgi:hypothetical protein